MATLCVSCDALSIVVSTGREGRRPSGMPPQPAVIINYPFELAQQLVHRVLRSHARPEYCFAGYYRHRDGNMTLGCYLVVPTPEAKYILGNERDMPEEEWAEFRERLGEFGSFVVSIGIETDDPGRNYLTKPEWFLVVPTFHRENIVPMVTAATFG